MKKFLFMAMAALVLMACEKNGSSEVSLPDQDKKALAHLCSAANFLNQTEAQLDKAFKEAGFKVYPSPVYYAPGQATQASGEAHYVHYCYNAPDIEGWTGSAENEQQYKAYNDVLKAGKIYINVDVEYMDGKFYKITGTFHVNSAIEGVNQVYLAASNAAYDVLPVSDGGYKAWTGTLASLGKEENTTQYDQDHRAAFAADLSSKSYDSVTELGHAIKGGSNIFQYNLTWSNELSASGEAEYMELSGYVIPAFGYIYAGAF